MIEYDITSLDYDSFSILFECATNSAVFNILNAVHKVLKNSEVNPNK